jgi:glycosyltransferase involved in cell wall biosynthesis
LRKIVESLECDIIHVHMNYHLAFGAALGARAKGIPLVLTLRREADLQRHPRWKREQLIQAYRMADLIISPSASLKRYCQQATGLDVTLIPSGTAPLFDERPELPPPRDNRLLFVGVLDQNKAILPLIDAVLELYGQGMGFEFMIVGDGPLREQVARRAANDSRIVLRGKVSRAEVCEEMRRASLLCVPSYTETLGLVYIEAMKQGLPVVGRKGTGIDGLGEQGVHYELVENDNSMASLLGGLMKDDRKRALLAENGRALASQWTWPRAAQRHVSEYERLLSGGSAAN